MLSFVVEMGCPESLYVTKGVGGFFLAWRVGACMRGRGPAVCGLVNWFVAVSYIFCLLGGGSTGNSNRYAAGIRASCF